MTPRRRSAPGTRTHGAAWGGPAAEVSFFASLLAQIVEGENA